MKNSTFTVHQIAYCQNCEWSNEEYKNFQARKTAYRHAKKTGHSVTVETGLITQYN